MQRLSLTALALAALTLAVAAVSVAGSGAAPLAAPVTAASARHCHRVIVEFKPDGAGGGQNILAWNVSCRKARRVVRACIKGTVMSGWTATANSDFTRITLRSGNRKIKYMPVGGGGCVPV